jgi:mannose-1-phosphate guanylyltransferase
MQALVLAGGEGTRLRPLTLTIPKAVLPLAGRPFLEYMLEWLGRFGVDDVILACGFGADAVRDVLGDTGPGGLPLRYLVEPEPLGTAGPVKFAEAELEDRFLVLNGDVLQDLDLGALIDHHDESGAAATVALYPVADVSAYGLVLHSAEGEVTEFVEKPDPDRFESGEINAGAYVLERSVLELIPAGQAVSIEREVFPRLVGEGLFAKALDGYWNDIGTPARYLDATWAILEGQMTTTHTLRPGEPLVEGEAIVDPSARVGPRAVVGGGSRVAPGSSIQDSVLLSGCVIGEGASVSGAILGPEVTVGESAEISSGAVLGQGASIAAGAKLDTGARVQPGEHVG